ncbi:MAG: GAF domain-containing protein [Chloroflexi bacterium]|nr:GAF domain-containing protein [Chloroflexota bacterium]
MPQTARELTGQSEVCSSDFIDSLDDEVMIIDRYYRIMDANASVLRRYNLTKPEIIGKCCYEVSHGRSDPCNDPFHECPVRTAWESGKSARSTHTHAGVPDTGQGETFSDVAASPLRDESGDIYGFALIVRDVTELKLLEEQTRQEKANFLMLNDIVSAMSQSLDLDTILEIALDKALALVRGKVGGILLLDPTTNVLSYRVYRGLSAAYLRGMKRLKMGEGIAGRAAALKEPIYVDDIAKDSRVNRPVVAREGLRAFASIPLISKDKVLGVLNLSTKDDQGFTNRNIMLVNSLSNQVAIAIENAMLYKEIREKEESVRELLRQIISIEEEERRRIARGLHDDVSQSLTGLALKVAAVSAALPRDAGIKRKFDEIQSLTVKMLDEINRVVYELRPTLLDDLGLIPAIEWLTDKHLDEGEIEVSFETIGAARALLPQVEIALFRITQEAITNIVRHASARRVQVTLEFKERGVAVTIVDDGVGFRPKEVTISQETGRGFGLLGMKERAELLSGNLTIESKEGRGTRIHVEIPTT